MTKLKKLITITIAFICVMMLVGCKSLDSYDRGEFIDVSIFSHLGEYYEPHTMPNQFDIDIYNSLSDDTSRALYLWRSACYNKVDNPYYSYFLNGGGGSKIAGILEGELEAQSTHISYGNTSYHKKMAIITDAKIVTVGGDSLVKTAQGKLNRGEEEYKVDGDTYKREVKDKATDVTMDAETRINAVWDSKIEKEDDEEYKTRDDFDTDTEYYDYLYKTELNVYFGEYSTPLSEVVNQGIVLPNSVDISEIIIDGKAVIKVFMSFDVEIINLNEEYTIEKLIEDTSANPVRYSKFDVEFEIWKDICMFRSYTTYEGWYGTLKLGFVPFSGEALSTTAIYFSYHPDDYNLIHTIKNVFLDN